MQVTACMGAEVCECLVRSCGDSMSDTGLQAPFSNRLGQTFLRHAVTAMCRKQEGQQRRS